MVKLLTQIYVWALITLMYGITDDIEDGIVNDIVEGLSHSDVELLSIKEVS